MSRQSSPTFMPGHPPPLMGGLLQTFYLRMIRDYEAASQRVEQLHMCHQLNAKTPFLEKGRGCVISPANQGSQSVVKRLFCSSPAPVSFPCARCFANSC
ncbi:hypothetical protein BS78_01G479400 [Paspalum vaginatum]|nr:hypothetical protein BS78_01G479400 [Paspalum vaginatum]